MFMSLFFYVKLLSNALKWEGAFLSFENVPFTLICTVDPFKMTRFTFVIIMLSLNLIMNYSNQ